MTREYSVFRKALLFFACVLLGATLISCSKQNEKPAKTILKAAISPSIPPFMFVENNQLVGMDYEIFKGFCDSRGYECQTESYDFQGMLGAVSSGQANIAFSGISITEKRMEAMEFSNPYIQNGWSLVSLSKRNIRIASLAQLKNYSIGFPTGAVFMGYVKDVWQPKGIYKVSQVKLYPAMSDVLTDLSNGNLDLMFVDDSMLISYVNNQKLPLQTSLDIDYSDKLGFAFTKGSPIREDFNKYIAELGPEKLKAMEAKWSGKPEVAVK